MAVAPYKRLKLGWHRRLRSSRRQVEGISQQAEAQIEKHLFKKFENLATVKRFIGGWIILMLLLIGGVVAQNLNLGHYYQSLENIPGGLYEEGITGIFTNANPLYATSDADSTVSSLIFAGLLKVDSTGQMVGDLASGYTVSDNGLVYTLHLKPNLTWQDGKPLTSSDVLFTFNTIQNPDAQSPLFAAWEGIKANAPDSHTVVFTLPDVLADFPYELTTGIVPEHLLSSVPPTELRSADFNTVDPVGAGPFAWDGVQVNAGSDLTKEQEQIALKPFDGYNGGQPKLNKFVVNVFADSNQLQAEFDSKQLTAMVVGDPSTGLITEKSGVVAHNFILRAATMVFFKVTNGLLSDGQVRRALVEATNTNSIIQSLGYPTRPVNEPLLMGQLGYNPIYAQPTYNLSGANQILTNDGWLMGKDGIRSKGGQVLTFTLTVANIQEDKLVSKQLTGQWQKIGLKLNVQTLQAADFQNTINDHSYDSVLTAISIGVDPDVYVYWDSSQADIRSANRLNLSEYKNPTVDTALESGRTRLSSTLRVIKYAPFLQAWQQDNPSMGLYQPRLLYLTNGTVGGLEDQALTSATDRFSNVQNWEIREAKVTR